MSRRRGRRRLIVVMSAVYALAAGGAVWAMYQHGANAPLTMPGNLTMQQLSDKQLMALLADADRHGRAAALPTAAAFAATYMLAWIIGLTARWVRRGYETTD